MITYRDGYEGQLVHTVKFQLPYELHPANEIRTEFIDLDCLGELIIRAGYSWDYASVPLTGWLSNKIAGKKSKTPSLVHDALCQLHRHGKLPHDEDRLHTDKFFYYLLLERKFWKFRAWLWFKAVRIGAKHHKQTPKKEYTAP
jgi:hypothetical protein